MSDAEQEPHTKQCRKCHEVKLANEFATSPRNLDGLQSYCRSCQNEVAKASYRKRHPLIPMTQEPTTTKECPTCHQTKNISEFYKDRCKKDGHSYDCKQCRKIYVHSYIEKNLEEVKAYHQKYFQTHREEFREAVKKWASLHPEKAREINIKAHRKSRAKKKMIIEEAWQKRLEHWKQEN